VILARGQRAKPRLSIAEKSIARQYSFESAPAAVAGSKPILSLAEKVGRALGKSA